MKYFYNREDSEWLVIEILSYLADHPDAQDTLEGVVQWWLLNQNIVWRTSMVLDALNSLIKSEYVLEVKLYDGRSIYRINHERELEIKEMLKKVVKGKEN